MVLSWLALILASLAVVSTPTLGTGDDIQVRVYPLTTDKYEAVWHDPHPVGENIKHVLFLASPYLSCVELATIEIEAPPGGLGDDAPLQRRLRQEVHDLGGNAYETKSGTVYTDTQRHATITARAYRIMGRTGRPLPSILLSSLGLPSLELPDLAGNPEAAEVRRQATERVLRHLRRYVAHPEKEDAWEKTQERWETGQREIAAHPYGKTYADIEAEVIRSTGSDRQKRQQVRRRVAELRKREWADNVLYAELYRIFEVTYSTEMVAEMLEPPSPSTGASPSFSPQPMLLDRFRPVGGAR